MPDINDNTNENDVSNEHKNGDNQELAEQINDITSNNGKAEVVHNEMQMSGNLPSMNQQAPNGLKIDTVKLENLMKMPKLSVWIT